MKGDKKKVKNGFKRGNKLSPNTGKSAKITKEVEEKVQYVRPTVQEKELLRDEPIKAEAMPLTYFSDPSAVTVKFLRSQAVQPSTRQSNEPASKDQIHTSKQSCYKLFHTEKLWDMVNTAVKEHISRSPKCTGKLNFDKISETQRGFAWRERVICSCCKYRSTMFKLYEEVNTGKRGCKAATANVGLNIAMTQTPVAATSVRKMMLAANIPAPSMSGMQKSASKINEMIKNENVADMKRRREQLKQINRWRKRPEKELAVQSDGMYNNSLYSGVGKTPFQPATQCTYTVVENITNKKQIIALETVNKLCSKHGFHTGTDEMCDIKAGVCTSTASMETNIGDEQKWAEMCFRDMHADGLEVKYLTTDPDTKAYQAATELYKRNVTSTMPEHQIDTRHLSENHRKQIKKSSHVLNMMPGSTKAYRQHLRDRFAIDISKRCQAEFEIIHGQENGNCNRLTTRLNKCIGAIKKCYSANHTYCKLFSSVCSGERNGNWIMKSTFLPCTFKIDLSKSENVTTLLECIEYRLSEETLCQTKLNTNTQKVEATNRSIKRSLPKNATFSRNFPGRAHSAVHSVNNGPGESIRRLCSVAGCPIPIGGKADRGLITQQVLSERKKERERSIAHKLKRKARRLQMYTIYAQHQEEKKYVRGQLLRNKALRARTIKQALNVAVPSTSSEDHGYTRRPRNNTKVRTKRQATVCRPTQEPASAQ